MEILITFAIFSILLGVAILMLSQAGRNMTFAQEGHNAHLAAQSLMMVVRQAFEDASENAANASAVSSALAAVINDYAYDRSIEDYSVWIVGATSMEFHSTDAPEADISFVGVPGLNISGSATVIVIAVWNEHGHIAGRAVGVVN